MIPQETIARYKRLAERFGDGNWAFHAGAILALLVERDAMRAALKPFADFANHFDGQAPEIDNVRLCELDYHDDCPTVGDCWEARKVLEGKP